jgi:hypothetical protein
MSEGAVETDRLKFANRYDIMSRWKPREESPKELGQRMLCCLDAISPLHPAFRDWKFLDLFRDPMEMTEENISEFLCPLEKARPRMTDIVADWGVYTDDDREPEPRAGYRISVSNSNESNSRLVRLSAHGGGLVSWTGHRRDASFETDWHHEADPSIVAYPLFKSILLTIVSCWDVDYANASCRDLWGSPMGVRSFCNPSWMVYLSAQLTQRIVVPSDVIVERTPDGGILMIAAEETFNVNNPDHMSGARSIFAALEPLNREAAERWARTQTWRPPAGSVST